MSEMKDSGVPYIKEVPYDWNVIPAQFAFREEKSKNVNNQYENAFSFHYGEIVPKGIIGEVDENLRETYSAYTIVSPNDIVINGLNLNYDFISQRIALVNEKGIITSAYLTVQPENSLLNPNYACFLLKSYDAQFVFHNMGSGIRKTLKYEDFKKCPIVVPPKKVQDKIVAFLWKKLAEIDSMIADAKANIEDYKALKQSIITQAVTKGLDPDVEMKDSGIQWIGMFPSHWSLPKVLYILTMPITDGPHTTPELFNDGVPFVSAEAVSCGDGGIDFNHIRGYVSEEFYRECCKKYIPQVSDIYMIKSGATTGKVSIVDCNVKFTIWSPLAVFRADENKIKSRYLFYSLQSDYFQTQVQNAWTYGTQQNIGMRSLETLKICLPSLSEQHVIVEYLDGKVNYLNAIINEQQSLIADLEAAKKSLIYECVTGKREIHA